MSVPSQSDFISGIDPTNQPTISGAQLLQLVSVATPFTDKGLVVVTDDIAGNPTVPDATGTTKWQNYLWIRQSSSSVSAYVWNDASAVDVTYQKWTSINIAGIAAGSIVNSMIADNTIQSVKIFSLDYSKLTGAPTGLPPSGAAGGVLTGTYPDPSLAANAVTTASITDLNVTSAKIENASATTGIAITKLAPVSGSAKDMARVNAGATGMEAFTPPIIFTGGIVVPGGNALKVPRVNAGATDFEMVALDTLGRVLQIVETQDNTADTTALNCASTAQPTTSNCKLPAGLTAAITPKSATSTLLVEIGMYLEKGTYGIAALFQDAGTDAIAAGLSLAGGSGTDLNVIVVRYKVVSGSTTLRTFKGGFSGSAGNTRYNSTDGATKPFGGTLGVNSWIRVTEYI